MGGRSESGGIVAKASLLSEQAPLALGLRAGMLVPRIHVLMSTNSISLLLLAQLLNVCMSYITAANTAP